MRLPCTVPSSFRWWLLVGQFGLVDCHADMPERLARPLRWCFGYGWGSGNGLRGVRGHRYRKSPTHATPGNSIRRI